MAFDNPAFHGLQVSHRIYQCGPRLNSLKKKQRKILLLQRIEAKRNLLIDLCPEVR
jgi:hypothetical protein